MRERLRCSLEVNEDVIKEKEECKWEKDLSDLTWELEGILKGR